MKEIWVMLTLYNKYFEIARYFMKYMKKFSVDFFLSEVELKPSINYSYYKAKYFQRFHYNYKLMRDCHDRIESLRRTKDKRKILAEDVIIKIGIVGEFTEDKLNLLLKRKGKV